MSFLLVSCLLFCGCGGFKKDLFISINNKDINKVIEEYNVKHGIKLKNEKMEIYKVTAYKEGYLVLLCYNEEAPKLTLLNIQKLKNKWSIVKEAIGEYCFDEVGVNSVEYEDGIIYFGNVYNQKGKNVFLKLDDGRSYSEKVDALNKGYIIVTDSKAAVVDFILLKEDNSSFNFIKDFLNYSVGIFETVWN